MNHDSFMLITCFVNHRFSTSNIEINNSVMEVQLSYVYTYIGCCLASKNLGKEAGEKHEQALRLRMKHLSAMHPLLSESLNYVGEAMLLLGQESKSIPFFIRALAIRRIAFGDGHPAVAHVLGLLASAQRNLGRFGESRINFKECIAICVKFFKPNHPNLIPNYINFGKLLLLEGDWVESIKILERALEIHKGAGRMGDVEVELVKMITAATAKLEKEGDKKPPAISTLHRPFEDITKTWMFAPKSKQANNANFILFTDPGRDLDDELSMVMLASCAKTPSEKVQLLGCVCSFGKVFERAHLTRGTLDVIGLPKIPVAAGHKDPNCPAGCSDMFAEQYLPPSSWKPYNSKAMLTKIFEEAEDTSVDFALIAAMTDAWNFMHEKEELFLKKIRSVSIMGGVLPFKEGDRLLPDESYNNYCDKSASRNVYNFCQEKGVKMVILSRFAAYAVPVPRDFYEELGSSGSLVARRLFEEQKHSIVELWKRASSPSGSVLREELPDRCNKMWFCKTFCDGNGQDLNREDEIWACVTSFNMYDPLSILASLKSCDRFFEKIFHQVNGTRHEIIGINGESNGIVKGMEEGLVDLILEHFSFGVDLPGLLMNGEEEEEICVFKL